MIKQPAVTAQTKKNIIDAFWSLYCEKRIDTITVKEIMQKAGYNRGTFYEYFIDVYDVLEQIENSLLPNLDELPPTTISSQHFNMPLDIFLKLYEQNSDYYSVLLGDNGNPAFASKLKNSTKPMLKEAYKTNAKITETELDFILEYILSAMIGVMSYWFQQNKVLPAPKLLSLMYDLMKNGVIRTLNN